MMTIPNFTGIIRLPDFDRLAAVEASFTKARNMIQAYYSFGLFYAVLRIVWPGPEAWMNAQAFRYSWGLFWVGGLPFEVIQQTITYLFLVSAFIGAAWWSSRWGRVIAAAGMWQLVSYIGSFSQFYYYQWFPWLYTSLLFVFLPTDVSKGGQARGGRKTTLMILWAALALYMLGYTTIFVSRISGALIQTLQGEASAFTVQGFHARLAEYSLQQPITTAYMEFFLAHPAYGLTAFVLGIYVCAVSFFTMFRPSLLRIWGFLLFFLNLAFYLVTTAYYVNSFLFLLLLLMDTPFLLKKQTTRAILAVLPILGSAARRIRLL